MSLNQCNFIGNLGAAVETRFGKSGTQVSTFTIACTEKYKGEEKTEWIKCVCFSQTAELAEKYLDKGSKVRVTGKYNTDKWTDKEGNKRYSVSIIVRELEFLSPRPQDQPGQRNYSESGNHISDAIEDVPF